MQIALSLGYEARLDDLPIQPPLQPCELDRPQAQGMHIIRRIDGHYRLVTSREAGPYVAIPLVESPPFVELEVHIQDVAIEVEGGEDDDDGDQVRSIIV